MWSTIPGWLYFLLGIVVGALGVLAIGPASDAYWEAVYAVRRFCMVVGAFVLGVSAVALVCWLVWHFGLSSS